MYEFTPYFALSGLSTGTASVFPGLRPGLSCFAPAGLRAIALKVNAQHPTPAAKTK
jgi:hypothetical protein